MNTSLTASIEPAVPDDRRTEDPVRRQRRLARADAAADEPLAGEPVRVRARCGRRSPSTPGCSPSTCRGSARPSAETISCPRARWAGSWPGSSPRRIWDSRTSSRRTSGTSAALFAAAAHPERIASVIVGSGGAAVPLDLGEPLRSRVLDPDLDKYRRMDPRVIVDTSLDTIAGGIPDDIRADYLACYDGDRYVESMRYVRTLPRGAARAGRAAAADHDARHDHQRPPRPRRSDRQRRVPRRAAAQQPARARRRRPFRLGGGAGGVRLDHPRRRSAAAAHEPGPHLTSHDTAETQRDRGRGSRASPTAVSAAQPRCRSCCCSTSAATWTTGTRR